MDVSWFEQTESDVPAGNDWLSRAEKLRLNSFRFAKRRDDWRLGRWTAKRAAAVWLKLPELREIEIRSAPSGAPEVFIDNQPPPMTISLSHRAGAAACAVAPAGTAVGCDLELIEPRCDPFVADYFTDEEQALIARSLDSDRFRIIALIWSAKESALKALGAGLRLDTRWVAVYPSEPGCTCNSWHPLCVGSSDCRLFHGWWQSAGNLVRTLVAARDTIADIHGSYRIDDGGSRNAGARV